MAGFLSTMPTLLVASYNTQGYGVPILTGHTHREFLQYLIYKATLRPFDLKNSWFPNSVMQYENLVHISSQSD